MNLCASFNTSGRTSSTSGGRVKRWSKRQRLSKLKVMFPPKAKAHSWDILLRRSQYWLSTKTEKDAPPTAPPTNRLTVLREMLQDEWKNADEDAARKAAFKKQKQDEAMRVKGRAGGSVVEAAPQVEHLPTEEGAEAQNTKGLRSIDWRTLKTQMDFCVEFFEPLYVVVNQLCTVGCSTSSSTSTSTLTARTWSRCKPSGRLRWMRAALFGTGCEFSILGRSTLSRTTTFSHGPTMMGEMT